MVAGPTMTRIHIVCEGQTEEMFVNNLLVEPFSQVGIYLTPSLIGKPGHKGGYVTFDRLLVDIRTRLLSDRTSFCTTFIDFYGLGEGFPGVKAAGESSSSKEKGKLVESAVLAEMSKHIPSSDLARFIPYVQMYEFEGLLFSDPAKFSSGIGRPDLEARFGKVRFQFSTPEDINDSRQTAPSKRILAIFAGYEKPVYGSLAALEIGLNKIRGECSRFDAWLNSLAELK